MKLAKIKIGPHPSRKNVSVAIIEKDSGVKYGFCKKGKITFEDVLRYYGKKGLRGHLNKKAQKKLGVA